MITARNYAAQAEYALKDISLNFKNKNNVIASEEVNNVIKSIQKSQHFALPDNGVLLGNDWQTIKKVGINIPFDNLTISYYSTKHGSSKNIFVIKTLYNINLEKAGFNVAVIKYKTDTQSWYFHPIGVKVCGDYIYNEENGEYYLDAELIKVSGFEDRKLSKEQESITISNLVEPVFDLLEALACKNIYYESLEPVDPKKNERRIKKGKLPIYETKVLCVKSTGSKIDLTWKGGTHASPRQHLRRGHIRRYCDYSIWIESTVVGKAENGKIDKKYEVR